MFLEMLGSSGQKPRKAKNSKKIKKGPDEPSISRNMLISEFRKYILVVILFTKSPTRQSVTRHIIVSWRVGDGCYSNRGNRDPVYYANIVLGYEEYTCVCIAQFMYKKN